MPQIGTFKLNRSILLTNCVIYETKEELGGEKSMGVVLKDGRTGYIPLTIDSDRIGRNPRILGNDGQKYSMATVKKDAYKDIDHCNIYLYTYEQAGSGNVTASSNYVQGKTSSANSVYKCNFGFKFYDKYNNYLPSLNKYTISDIPYIIEYNLYYSLYGGSVSISHGDELIGTNNQSVYRNTNLTQNTKFNSNSNMPIFSLSFYSNNNNSNNVVKITINKIKIGGKVIPITGIETKTL